MDPQYVRNYVYWSRDLKDKQAFELAEISRWLIRGMNHFEAKTRDLKVDEIDANPSKMKSNATTSLVANGLHDCKLVDLAEGVKYHPQGRGRQGLTHAIEHAVKNRNKEVLLSETRGYVEMYNLFDVKAGYNCAAEDWAARERVQWKTKAYFKNLSNSAGTPRGEPQGAFKERQDDMEIIDLTKEPEDEKMDAETSDHTLAEQVSLQLGDRIDAASGIDAGVETDKDNGTNDEEKMGMRSKKISHLISQTNFSPDIVSPAADSTAPLGTSSFQSASHPKFF